MARVAHDDVAEVLAKISNVCIEDNNNPLSGSLRFEISMIITDFLEERESIAVKYDNKLKLPELT